MRVCVCVCVGGRGEGPTLFLSKAVSGAVPGVIIAIFSFGPTS